MVKKVVVVPELTPEERIAAQEVLERYPETALTEEEKIGIQASEVAAGDWGPVFCYGMMLSQQAWCALIGRIPDMRVAMLRGYERRGVRCCAFAGLLPLKDGMVVGQACLGLRPWERRLLDAVVDDAFSLIDVVVHYIDDVENAVECTTYIWRKEFEDALTDNDWDQMHFADTYLEQFTQVCADMRVDHESNKMSEEELKELALVRRRTQTGFEDAPEELPDDDDDQDEEAS
mmetsp:Transcript_142671/g.248787  ORF Transcript_142671/g.248787 Transcript_142671/m.248787 type:complete len:232 (+) Transcript_142671:113-808(+)